MVEVWNFLAFSITFHLSKGVSYIFEVEHMYYEGGNTFSCGCSIHPSKDPEHLQKVPKHPLKYLQKELFWSKSLTQYENPKTSRTLH